MKLPKRFMERDELRDLDAGESAWVNPSTLYADETHEVWINGLAYTREERVGTFTMHVLRTEDGVEVLSGAGHYRPGLIYVSRENLIPVVAMHGEPEKETWE